MYQIYFLTFFFFKLILMFFSPGPADAGPRVILSVDLWHPNVAAAERQALDFMFSPDLWRHSCDALHQPCLVVAGYESLCKDQNDRSHARLAHITATRPEFPNWHHPEVKREPMGGKESQCEMGDWLCLLCLPVVFCMWNPSWPVTRFRDEKLMHAD